MGNFIATKVSQLLGFLLSWWAVMGLWDLLVASGFFTFIMAIVVTFLFVGALFYMLLFD